MDCKMDKLVIELLFMEMVDLSKNMDKFNYLQEKAGKNMPNANFDFANNTFILNNPIEMSQCILQPNRLLIIYDKVADAQVVTDKCNSIIKCIEDIQLYNHVILRKGVRIYYLDKRSNSDEVDACIKNNFFNTKKVDLLGKDLKNVGIHFVENRQDYIVNYNISSAINGEVSIDSLNGNVINNKSTPVLVIDLDFHKDENNQKMSDTYNFVNSVVKESLKIVKQLEGVME